MNPGFYVTPEQLVRDRAEFARKGIARGRSILALEYRDGILMLAENPGGALNKISEVYDRIAFAGVGRYNEFETLRKAGIRQADVMGYLYSRDDVTALGLATAFSQTLGVIFSHETKPFEVELLICELGREGESNQMLQISYDGTLLEGRGTLAIGGKADALGAALGDRFESGLDRMRRSVWACRCSPRPSAAPWTDGRPRCWSGGRPGGVSAAWPAPNSKGRQGRSSPPETSAGQGVGDQAGVGHQPLRIGVGVRSGRSQGARIEFHHLEGRIELGGDDPGESIVGRGLGEYRLHSFVSDRFNQLRQVGSAGLCQSGSS